MDTRISDTLEWKAPIEFFPAWTHRYSIQDSLSGSPHSIAFIAAEETVRKRRSIYWLVGLGHEDKSSSRARWSRFKDELQSHASNYFDSEIWFRKLAEDTGVETGSFPPSQVISTAKGVCMLSTTYQNVMPQQLLCVDLTRSRSRSTYSRVLLEIQALNSQCPGTIKKTGTIWWWRLANTPRFLRILRQLLIVDGKGPDFPVLLVAIYLSLFVAAIMDMPQRLCRLYAALQHRIPESLVSRVEYILDLCLGPSRRSP